MSKKGGNPHHKAQSCHRQGDQKNNRLSHAQVASTRGSKRENATPATNSVCPTQRLSTAVVATADDAALASHKTTDMSYEAVATTPVWCGEQRSLLTAYLCSSMTRTCCLLHTHTHVVRDSPGKTGGQTGAARQSEMQTGSGAGGRYRAGGAVALSIVCGRGVIRSNHWP